MLGAPRGSGAKQVQGCLEVHEVLGHNRSKDVWRSKGVGPLVFFMSPVPTCFGANLLQEGLELQHALEWNGSKSSWSSNMLRSEIAPTTLGGPTLFGAQRNVTVSQDLEDIFNERVEERGPT